MSHPLLRASRSPFLRFAQWASHASGRPQTFGLAVFAVVLWAVTGPLFGFSDTWQLVINTSTTIVTFLMVFLIQATQNRDTAAMQVKLDELIRVIGDARNVLLDLEQLDEGEIEKLRAEYLRLAEEARGRR
ncbi:MAG TPA: low affinity iron permease family protein [Myxococcota bacterium]|nr:low affinity iron permease family protein [Myxococcota bacterium]